MYLERFTGLSFPSIRPDFLKYRTGSKLELDGFNEEYRVAFEYNGIGHYIKDSRQSEEDFIKLKARDEWKYKKTKENGIMLLTIKESENGVSPDDIRSIALNFILKCELPLVDNFETIFVNTAEIYLVDPRIEVAKEAKKLNLVMVSDQYISRNYKIPFECLNCKYIRNVSPYDISAALDKGKTSYCPQCSGNLKLTLKKIRNSCETLGLSLISKEECSSNDYVDVICNNCKTPNQIKAGTLNNYVKNGSKIYCPTCSKKKKRTIASINDELARYGFIIVSTEIKNVDTPILIRYPDGTIKNRSFSYIKRHISKINKRLAA